MTVTTTVATLKTLPFPSNDPRYPTFRWVSTGTVLGDASAGEVIIRLELGLTRAGVLSGLVFGLDTLSGVVSLGGGGDLTVVTSQFRLTELGDTNALGYPLDVRDSGAEGVYGLFNLRSLLGRQAGSAVTAELIFEWDTNVDTAEYRAYAHGYIWQPIALLQGGPLFPGDYPTP